MKKLFTLLMTAIIAVSMSAQVDVTYKITNPSFEDGDEGWTNTNFTVATNDKFSLKDGTTFLEKWVASGSTVGDAEVYQTVKNLPKGDYRLIVAAQHINQADATVTPTGAYIYAKTILTKTVVTAAADYTVDFSVTTTTGSAKIGFKGKSADGNWLSVDNFRLTFLSTDTANVNALITSAQAELDNPNYHHNDVNINALTNAINDAKSAVESGATDLTKVALALEDAYVDAQANHQAYTTLKSLVTKAKLIQGKKMSPELSASLDSLIAASELAQTTTDNDPVALTEALQNVYDKANTNIAAFTSLENALTSALTIYDESKNGAAEYKAVLDEAQKMYDDGTASNDEITAEITVINTAKFKFNLANPTPGEGTAPEVTETNHYVPTGSTEAMMRATYVGDNVLEKGVCWSTEHNPTVLDSRTTKSFTLNGTIIHVKGLETATVYYLRPYIINKTYTVAYGDEVKIVTHPKGTCKGTWDEGAPTEEANTRCRNAINETIEYFNQWTGIKGFTLSGHYGASTPTADCSYGGWMRIGPNAGNQAIGTVIHETGHGVGVGTSSRWSDTNVHNWKWYGREANTIYSFLENKTADPYNSDFCMVGDSQHGWGSSASYDWFVNGADKDKHYELQYIGGCVLLYGLFIDGLNPTSAYTNGIPGYTYNFDDAKKYYIMNNDTNFGCGDALLYQRNASLSWNYMLSSGEAISDSAAWYMEYNAQTGYYYFKNASTGKYISHSSTSNMSLKTTTSPSTTEQIQLMPDRTDIALGDIKTHGYWFNWGNGSTVYAMTPKAYTKALGYGSLTPATLDYSDAEKQNWIIISEDELPAYQAYAVATGIRTISVNDSDITGSKKVVGIYTTGGIRLQQNQHGFNIIKYSDGSTQKIFVK